MTATTLPGWLTLTQVDGHWNLHGTPANANAGANQVVLVLSDGQADVEYAFSINVNARPVFQNAPPTTVNAFTQFQWNIVTTDAEGDPITLMFDLPSWLSCTITGNGTATIVGTPTNANVGDFQIIAYASDGSAATTQTFASHVNYVNRRPVFTSTAPNIGDGSWAATSESRWTYNITATDADGDPFTISAKMLPTWLTLTDHGDGTATLSGIPTNANANGNQSNTLVDLRLYDNVSGDVGVEAIQAFSLMIFPINHAPTFTTTAPATAAAVNAPYAYSIVAADVDILPNGQTLSFTAPTKPAWLTLTDNGNGTATLSGTPTIVGSYAVTLRVSDGYTTTDQSFTIVVPQPNRAPVLSPTFELPDATSESPYTAVITATDADGDPISFTVTGVHGFYTVTDDGNGHLVVTGTPDQRRRRPARPPRHRFRRSRELHARVPVRSTRDQPRAILEADERVRRDDQDRAGDRQLVRRAR
jgi:hypothetical protein